MAHSDSCSLSNGPMPFAPVAGLLRDGAGSVLASPSGEPQLTANTGRGHPRPKPPKGGGQDVSLTWHGADYPRVREGNYKAACVATQGPEFCRAFQRQSLRLEFALLDDGTLVSMFLNMGSSGKVPGSQSRFFKVWTMANGEQPRKGQKMTLSTFTEPGLIYTISVEDCRTDVNQKTKDDALVYSRVTDVLQVERR